MTLSRRGFLEAAAAMVVGTQTVRLLPARRKNPLVEPVDEVMDFPEALTGDEAMIIIPDSWSVTIVDCRFRGEPDGRIVCEHQVYVKSDPIGRRLLISGSWS